MNPSYEDGWWAVRSGVGRSTAHIVLLRMAAPEIRSDCLMLACGAVRATGDVRPRLPVDYLCLPCCQQGVKTLPPRGLAVEWLAPSFGDYNCGACAVVIHAGERLAWAPSPGQHGVLLCEPCAEHVGGGSSRSTAATKDSKL